MTTLLLGTTDKQLAMLKERNDAYGKDARKEIKRRKMIGYWDGTNAVKVDRLEVIDADLDKKEEYVYAPGVKVTQVARERGKDNDHLSRWRRRMAWFYRAKQDEQAEDKPKPVVYYYDPEVADHFIKAKQSETTSYFDEELVKGIQTKKDTNADKQ